jgi:pimeloyl-ACP methyl ester carboxylesterase
MLDRLVLLSPPVRGRIGLRLDVPLRTMWGRRVFQRLRPAWRTLTRVGMPSVFAPTPEALPVKMEAARRKVEDARRASWRATIGGAQMVVQNNYADRLDEIEQPVLVVVGDWDLTIPPEEGMFAARMMPHARLLHLPRVAHQVTDDAPLDVRRALLDFLLASDEEVYDGG